MRKMNYIQENYEIPIESMDDLNENIQLRIDELKSIANKLNMSTKYLNFQEKIIIDKKNELDNNRLKLEDEEKYYFSKYQNIMDSSGFINNFNQEFSEMINSIDLNNPDEAENNDNDEIMKQIYLLRERIMNKLDDISTVDADLQNREDKLKEEFENLTLDRKDLFKKLENEFILNSDLYFESPENQNIFNNLNSEILNEENINEILQNIRKSMINFKNTQLSASMDDIYNNKAVSKNSKSSSPNDKKRISSKSKEKDNGNANNRNNISRKNKPSPHISPKKMNNDPPLKNLKNFTNKEKDSSIITNNFQGYANPEGHPINGVKLNRTFFSIRNKKMKEIAEKNTPDYNYADYDYCRKNCREKLFKDLDLNQRYYLNKANVQNLHSENCPVYIKETMQNKGSPNQTTLKNKRKNQNNSKDDTLLNVSLAKSTTNGVLMDLHSDNSRMQRNINDKFLANELTTKSNENRDFNSKRDNLIFNNCSGFINNTSGDNNNNNNNERSFEYDESKEYSKRNIFTNTDFK